MVIRCHQSNTQGAGAGMGKCHTFRKSDADLFSYMDTSGKVVKRQFFQAAENYVHKNRHSLITPRSSVVNDSFSYGGPYYSMKM